jgi:predicted permease
MTELRQDILCALRASRRHIVLTVVAVLTLSLGFGVTIGMFSVMNALLFRPLPVPEPDRLVAVSRLNVSEAGSAGFSYPSYTQLRDAPAVLDGLAAFTLTPVTVEAGAGAGARRIVTTFVSDNYFKVLRVKPAAGRLLIRGDAAPGADPAVVLGWEEWHRRFAGARNVVGQTIRLNGIPATIVGVAPKGFNGTIGMLQMDLWASLSTYQAAVSPGSMSATNRSWLTVFGRLRNSVTTEQTRASLESRLRAGEASSNAAGGRAPRLSVATLRSNTGSARSALAALSAFLVSTALLVLGIASTNVAGLLLARGLSREKEFAMRAALGASRGRILVQSLTESLLVWMAGSALGLLVAMLIVRMLPQMIPVQRSFPVHLYLDATADMRVIGFATVVSVIAGLTFGAIPAIRASNTDLMLLLRDNSGAGRFRSWVHSTAVATQVGASIMLLVVAGLFVRSIGYATSVDPGFEPDQVTWASVDLGNRGDADGDMQKALATLVQTIGDDPRVAQVSVSSEIPLGGTVATTVVRTSGSVVAPVRISWTSANYFQTLQIPILSGREFTGALFGEERGLEVVVSRSAAERLWPGRIAVGQQLELRGTTGTVIGVAANVQSGRLGESPHPTVYLPFSGAHGEAHLLVRSLDGGVSGTAVIRQAVERSSLPIPIMGPSPLRDVILSAIPQTALAQVIGGFGLLGLALTTVGLFGAVTFFSVQCTHELGVRAALGAAPLALLRFVLARGMAPAFTGLIVGVCLALGVSRLLQALLLGFDPWDPVTFLLSPLLLVGIGGAAAIIPALRVVRRGPALNLNNPS